MAEPNPEPIADVAMVHGRCRPLSLGHGDGPRA
jgi:hypothetical protein